MPGPPELPRIRLKHIFRAAVLAIAAWFVLGQIVPREDLRIVHLRAAFGIGGAEVVLEGPLFCVRPMLRYGPWGPGTPGDFQPRPFWWGQALKDGRILVLRHPRAVCDGETPDAVPIARLLDGGGPPQETGEWLYLTQAALAGGDGPLRLTGYEVRLKRRRASRLRWRLYDEAAMAPRDLIDYRRAPARNMASDHAAFVIPFTTDAADIAEAARSWPVQSARYAVLDSPACDMATGLNVPLRANGRDWASLERILGLTGPAERPVLFRLTRTWKTYAPEGLVPLRRDDGGGWRIAADSAAPVRIGAVSARSGPVEGELILPDGTRARLRTGAVIWDRQQRRALEVVGPFPGCLRPGAD